MSSAESKVLSAEKEPRMAGIPEAQHLALSTQD